MAGQYGPTRQDANIDPQAGRYNLMTAMQALAKKLPAMPMIATDRISPHARMAPGVAGGNESFTLQDLGGLAAQMAPASADPFTMLAEAGPVDELAAPLLGALTAMVRKSDPNALRKVYHGSPHKIPPEPGYPMGRFKDEFIGTGEGGRAKGHGHYQAENPETGEFYRESLSDPKIVDAQGLPAKEHDTASAWLESGGSYKEAKKQLQKELKDSSGSTGMVEGPSGTSITSEEFFRNALSALDHMEKKGIRIEDAGYVYESALKVADEDFLLWDKAISQQSEKVKTAIQNHVEKQAKDIEVDLLSSTWPEHARLVADTTRENLLKRTGGDYLEHVGRNEIGTKELQSLGIKGVKFLDAGSRDTGKGTFNFVVFDPEDLEILRILGITGAVGLGAAASQQGPPTPDVNL